MPCLYEHCWARTIYPNHRNLKENEVYRRKNRYLCGWKFIILMTWYWNFSDTSTIELHMLLVMPKILGQDSIMLHTQCHIWYYAYIQIFWWFRCLFDIGYLIFLPAIKYCILYVLIPLAIICFFIWPNDELYMQLDQKYKNEKHRKLKGWLILVYIILSILLPILTMILLWE